MLVTPGAWRNASDSADYTTPTASTAARTSGAWCREQSSSRTYVTKRSLFMAPLIMRWRSTRLFSMMPTTVMFPPQLAGLCQRPAARAELARTGGKLW